MSKIIEKKLNGHKDTVLSVACHNKQEICSTGSDDCTVRIWDLKSNKTIKCIGKEAFNDNPINNVCFDDDYLLYCSYDNIILSFDLRQPNIILKQFYKQYKYNNSEINQLNFDSKFQYLGACDDSGQTKIIDLQKDKLAETLSKKHLNICSSVVFKPNSKNELITGSMDFSIIHWDFLKSKVLHRESFNPPIPLTKNKNKKDNNSNNGDDGDNDCSQPATTNQMLNPPFVNSIDISNNSKHVSVGLGNGDLIINEISSFKQYLKINCAHKSSISQVQYPKYLENNYDTLITVGNYDKKIILWDVSEECNERVSKLPISDDQNNPIDNNNERIKLWTTHSEKINCLTTSPIINNNIFIADISNDLSILSVQ
ncbi:hypothetical protein DICPUDRAFT_153694 [Dictyostelium purpureum]|uniref:Uncharacterized protein n=1 Tax=Dictyostelium purpureum TaxID=5786 RepID=F0ZPJ1_DICPU|nr:uncharacterized protein DICPUDRAFT_153694 [Dictyostelium purpureum]EGC34143.1 hypothetical protein DICPUDRAFT_153694 [Dictyostelium purpureum]|eukprot:XP_003289341.1 hypothetical protein DICPUDRAFT_153694 [Dictyostelium purpureum]